MKQRYVGCRFVLPGKPGGTAEACKSLAFLGASKGCAFPVGTIVRNAPGTLKRLWAVKRGKYVNNDEDLKTLAAIAEKEGGIDEALWEKFWTARGYDVEPGARALETFLAVFPIEMLEF